MKKIEGILRLIFLMIPLSLITAIGIKFSMPSSYGKYESEATGLAAVQYAMYVIKEDYGSYGIKLEDIVPSSESYSYVFSVSNYDGNKLTDVAIEYDLSIVTTTNLPLTYDLFLSNDLNNSIVTNRTVEQDATGAYFNTMETSTKYFGYEENETYIYVLKVDFPLTYKDYEYQDIVDFISINIDSKQKVD